MPKARLVVVGGGVLGTMHALEGVRHGYEVVQLERDLSPRGASVRNFGLIWVSGRAAGPELELALDARERWEKIGAEVAGTGFRAIGSLTVARSEAESRALRSSTADPDAVRRGTAWMDPEAVRVANPAIRGEIQGALYCERDAAVEPRLVLGALRTYLEASGSYQFLPGVEVHGISPHAVIDHKGKRYEADLVVCCPGAASSGPFGELFDAAPLRRVRLQMLETEPFEGQLSTAIADGDSMRYYPAFESAREMLEPQDEIAAKWRAQLLMVRRLSGHLTIGDTHAYAEPFPFDVDDAPTRHLMGVARALLGLEAPPVERRWAGVYCEVTEPGALYYRAEVEPGVVVVSGPGGRGMTMSPAIAADTFR
jgi:FAD dependent oxidoreductase TIGR03364